MPILTQISVKFWGLTVTSTISELLEQTKDPKAIPAGMAQNIFIEYKLQQSLVETRDIDLLVMGGHKGQDVTVPMIFYASILRTLEKTMTMLLWILKLDWNTLAAAPFPTHAEPTF